MYTSPIFDTMEYETPNDINKNISATVGFEGDNLFF